MSARIPPDQDIADFLSCSPAMNEVLRTARKVAKSDTTLLLCGETGSGKDRLARTVHEESARRDAPFIAVNCGAVPENLLESELFGHEKGAFTGAERQRRGLFEAAHGGTLFLDEIGEMPVSLQVKLLRILQDRSLRRLGSETSIEIDVRVLAATNQDLDAALRDGRFRQDLYYRLAVVRIDVPSLRERREDIPLLAERYFEHFTRKLGRTELRGLSKTALSAMNDYVWPGNVRELINVIERAVLLCETEQVDLIDLPTGIGAPAFARNEIVTGGLEDWLEQPLEMGKLAVLADFERRYLRRLLEKHQGNLSRTASQAEIDPRTLYNKMRAYGLRKEDFKASRA